MQCLVAKVAARTRCGRGPQRQRHAGIRGDLDGAIVDAIVLQRLSVQHRECCGVAVPAAIRERGHLDRTRPGDGQAPGCGTFGPACVRTVGSRDANDLSAAWPGWRLDFLQTAAHAVSALKLAQGRRLQLGHALLTGRYHVRGTPPPHTVCLMIAEGGPVVSSGRTLGLFEIDVLTAASGIDCATRHSSSLLLVTVDEAMFDREARRLLGLGDIGIRLRMRLRIAHPELRSVLRRQLREKLAAAMHPATLLADAAVAAAWETQILGTVLSAVVAEPVRELESRRVSVAAMAETYLRDNLLGRIAIADVAAAVGVSERALHAGFHERFGVSPAAYLKALRLSGARRELCLASSTRTVTEIALRWGFTHLGRFATDYRAHFGELPSETRSRQHHQPVLATAQGAADV
jgi:AraC family ethanolamine operon transcriptional activator